MTTPNSSGKKIPNPPRKCLFCGSGSLSKEHIYADWMREYLESDPLGTTHRVSTWLHGPSGESLQLRGGNGRLQLKGEHRSRGLKVVCKACNETWMSALQGHAKPALQPMLEGQRYSPSRDEQRSIAAWATMFTMIYECADPETAAITEQQKHYFRHHRKPPKNWLIWVGRFGGKRTGRTYHRGSLVVDRDGLKDAVSIGMNTQITAGTAGSLVFVTFSTSSDNTMARVADKVRAAATEMGLIRVWPTVGFRQLCHGEILDMTFRQIVETISSVLYEGLGISSH